MAKRARRTHGPAFKAKGVLPVQFRPGEGRVALGLTGEEEVDLLGLPGALRPDGRLRARFRLPDGTIETELLCRIETEEDAADLRAGGILPSLARGLREQAEA
jgi:aconitate hydratase